MLDVNPETVCRLIELAREINVREQAVVPEDLDSSPGDWRSPVLAADDLDMSEQEFISIVSDLEPDQQQQVVALLWLGREDFDLGEWKDILEKARDEWTDYTADYLLKQPLLPDFLANGLYLHGYNCDAI